MRWSRRLGALLGGRAPAESVGGAAGADRAWAAREESPSGSTHAWAVSSGLEPRVHEIGRRWLAAARAGAQRSASEWLVEQATRDPGFKVQLFRFVDVFPMLRSAAHAHEVLVEYFTQPGIVLPPGTELGLRAAGLAKGLATRAIGGRIEAMAQNFIAGASVRDALPRLRQRWEEGVAFSVDLLGEASVSDAEAAACEARYLEAIDVLADEVSGWSKQERLEADPLGTLPRANVSLKLSSFDPRAGSLDVERAVDRLVERLEAVLRRAAQRGVFVNFDMEQFALQELVLRVFERCCERVDFAAGVALQAYLRSADGDAQRLIEWARGSGRLVTVRLVKGAYWDYETVRAELEGWPVPVWSSKPQTDACFERLTERFARDTPRRAGEGGVRLALGSHNARSIAVGLAALEAAGLPPSALELQMLFGMAAPLKAVALAEGVRLREYTPVGALLPGMAYLVRRLLENTSNESWLRAGFRESADDAQLLSPPSGAPPVADPSGAREAERHALGPAHPGVGDGLPFRSEPARDFSEAATRGAFRSALARAALPPAPPDCRPEELAAVLERARAAFPAWRAADPLARAGALVEAARRMRARRDELAGLVIRENGKTWADADAEVCEAIDFCEFYARSATALLAARRLGRFAGELDEQHHEPRGPAAVISPWNFPLAITAGMTTAALVAGNPVVLKPAEQTPRIARVLVELLWEAGVPRDVLQFAPGPGETIGAALVRDPRVALIAFTGSREAGFDILEAASRTPPEQPHVKRVVCEMGGKNAIIVDDTADLDEAVLGVRASAFGYQGQKCSACSRVIVLDGVYELFLERLIAATRALVPGDPLEPDTDLGPLIDIGAARKVREYIEIGRGEGRLELAIEVPAELEARVGRPFVGPHIFSGIESGHRLAREEIFGPVLAVLRAASFEDALEAANATPYRLTGGVFSRQPSRLERARRDFRVGNLYLNRAITGARVGRQPFGGLGWSGLGSQAGGGEYLLQFLQPRLVCESTMRRGFSPESVF